MHPPEHSRRVRSHHQANDRKSRMGSTYSWHPGTRLTSVKWRWAIPVPMLEDELLSSWLIRTALAHGCDSMALAGQVWPKWRAWTGDLDRSLSPSRVSALAEASGIPPHVVQVASLSVVAGKLTPKFEPGTATWRWILPIGSRNRKRHGGPQFCPRCFLVDPAPFYRLQWRLAWHTCCEAHGCDLIDRCPGCGSPPEPHRIAGESSDLARCHFCKLQFASIRTSQASANRLNLQNAVDLAVHRREVGFGTGPIPTVEWLQALREVIGLIRRSFFQKSQPLWDRLQSHGVSDRWLNQPSTGLAFELLPQQERSILLEDAAQVLNSHGGSLTQSQMNYLRTGNECESTKRKQRIRPTPVVQSIGYSKNATIRRYQRLLRSVRGLR